MAKIINISDKLSSGKPSIQIGDKLYTVDDSLQTVMKFEEMYSGSGDMQSMLECLKVALGAKACTELKFEKMSFNDVRVWFFAIMAAMQDEEYEVIESRFRKFDKETE